MLLLFIAALIAALVVVVRSVQGAQPPVHINEIAWAGTSSSANDEWIELYNTSASDIDLTGWRLVAEDGSPAVTLKGEILAHGFFLLERTDDSTTPALADMLYTGALSNNGELLKLTDPAGRLIDSVPGLPTEASAQGGWQAGDNTTKQTMARADDLTWRFGMVDGTPGAANTFSAAPVSPSKTNKKAVTPTKAIPSSAAPAPSTTHDASMNDQSPPAQNLPATVAIAQPFPKELAYLAIPALLVFVGALWGARRLARKPTAPL
ncbi:MAG: lamin tail domain-containing protein [Candidatus Spechtbacterales bacterium]